jgi:hypothetical protein
VDGVAIGAEVTAFPYSISWDTHSVLDGRHSLTAVARDAAGNTRTSAAVSVRVNNVLPLASLNVDEGRAGSSAALSGAAMSGGLDVIPAVHQSRQVRFGSVPSVPGDARRRTPGESARVVAPFGGAAVPPVDQRTLSGEAMSNSTP